MPKRIIISFGFVFLMLVLLGMPIKGYAATMESQAGIVSTASGRLYVRSSPSTGSTVLTSLGKGSYVTLISKSGSWWYVEYAKGKYGYCHSDYITPASGSAVTVATQFGNLNVRSGAGTSYSKTGSVAKGEVVVVLSGGSGWSRILYHGTKTGYVSSQYLASYYTAVSLRVPGFKQMDSRWASMQVGESGKTFAQIGCATTAIAMMESYRRGTNIYPNVMAQSLRYTTDGSVYWPSDYATVTNSSGYLNKIYSLLKQGKPVLFGARNSYGKQHWVVITGFSGGDSLSSARFTIHDPGSSYRGNLQLLLDEYPLFYKYFYY